MSEYRIPGPYLHVECECGHKTELYERQDGPERIIDFMQADERWLKCDRCGRRGRVFRWRKGYVTAKEWRSSN